MATSSNTTCNESTSTEEVSANADNNYCRLRNELNVNCLIKVFEYLPMRDLMVLIKMDPFFKDIIFKWTLTKRMIQLPYARETRWCDGMKYRKLIDMFETIGKSMRKLTLATSHFSFFLDLIIKYCEPATLTDIVLCIDNAHNFSERRLPNAIPTGTDLMDLSMPFFSNLRRFELTYFYASNTTEGMEILNVFTEKLLIKATTLRSLYICGLTNVNGWLKYVKNLHALDILVTSVNADQMRCLRLSRVTMDPLITSLASNPQLKRLKIFHAGHSNIEAIGAALSKFCPNLEHFSEYEGIITYKQNDKLMTRYNFLSTMKNLNHVQLTSLTSCGYDLYYPLKKLANSNIVHLQIDFSYNRKKLNLDENIISDLQNQKFPNFYKLRTFGVSKSGDEVLNLGFIFHLMKHLKNLKTCKVTNIYDIHKMLHLAPSIQVLGSNWMDETAETNIIETLRTNRRSNGSQHLLNLILPSSYNYGNCKRYFRENGTKDLINVSYYFHPFDLCDELTEGKPLAKNVYHKFKFC